MRREKTWGDNIALEAIANVLQRPIAIWRKDSQQPPTVVRPGCYVAATSAEPVYVELDETSVRGEHYSALIAGRVPDTSEDVHVKYILGVDASETVICVVCEKPIRGAVCAGGDGADTHFGCAHLVDQACAGRLHDQRVRKG